jgi:hypothetical protein
MIRTEIYIEDQLIDLLKDIGTDFTYSVDDVKDFGSKNTSFSRTISIPATARNNQIFGFAFEIGMSQEHNMDLPNVNTNFTASQAAKCEVYIDKIQIFKGVIRILEMVTNKGITEYQCAVFGELGGFITELGNRRLEDLDFSEYNHTYNVTEIEDSWDTVNGSGYFYPLIDYGNVSSNKDNFSVSAFRPALYVKEYMEKIFEGTTYTLNCDFFDTAFFKTLIIPNNSQGIRGTNDRFILGTKTISEVLLNSNTPTARSADLPFDTTVLLDFTENAGKSIFTYTGSTKTVRTIASITGVYQTDSASSITGTLYIAGVAVQAFTQNTFSANNPFTFSFDFTGNIANTNTVRIEISVPAIANTYIVTISSANINLAQITSQIVDVAYNGVISINENLPKGIFQKDFFLSICKMFNMYVFQDNINEKQINISPYIDFYGSAVTNSLDWSQKIDTGAPMSIKPMSQLNARYYAYKYTPDRDLFNDNYLKKYGQSYGDNLYDSEFDFVKDTASTQIIFAPTVLLQPTSHGHDDKYFSVIYSSSQENPMDSVIRILMAKKLSIAHQWHIKSGVNGAGSNLASLNTYGYAGHLNDPVTPTIDINFGVPKELQFPATTYPTNNLFNTYHLPYLLEVTDMESKLLTCKVYLTTNDIYNLDFSKYIWINGVLFRLNKVDGYNPMDYRTTQVNLLKVINTN